VDTPGNQAYGVSNKCNAKTGGCILQAVAIVILSKRLVLEKLKETIMNAASISLDASTLALLTYLEARTTTKASDFASFFWQPLLRWPPKFLSKANKKIKTNVEGKSVELYGKQRLTIRTPIQEPHCDNGLDFACIVFPPLRSSCSFFS
jgi:hypothetical protein